MLHKKNIIKHQTSVIKIIHFLIMNKCTKFVRRVGTVCSIANCPFTAVDYSDRITSRIFHAAVKEHWDFSKGERFIKRRPRNETTSQKILKFSRHV